MPNPPIAAALRARLLREGFSRGYANRTARELAEHWEDLVEESLRQGCSRAEAESHATAQMGTAEPIGNELAARLRESSLIGRHPTTSFAAIAILTTYVWWTILVMAVASATGLWGWDADNPKQPPPDPNLLRASVDWIRSLSYVIVPFLICLIAQRYRVGWKPGLWGCLIVAIHNATHFLKIESRPDGHGSVAWGYSFSFQGPELLPVVVPIGVFLIFMLWRLRPEPADETSNLRPC